MKILANRRIRLLFRSILVCVLIFAVLSLILLKIGGRHASLYILLGALCMSGVVLLLCWNYFREQQKVMEDAVSQIESYISGEKESRIECEDEGELYRLFHEVNTLASILNAHAENEQNAKKFLKNTISDISHQLKTPLAALNVYNGILQEEGRELPAIQEFCSLSEQELDRIESLVQNLLKITKLDSGTITMEKSWESLSEIAERVRKSFSFRAGQEGKELCFAGERDVLLYCDRGWIEEAVGNLVKNALDHTAEGDSICVEWKAFASVIQIVVKDSGSGIAPEDLHHIFKRFYRSRFSQDTQGIGLGLPLVKAVAEAHNGTVEVESEPKAGAAFTMNFLIPTKL